jgi:anti-sigma regulatory factor (Ser/Thr protein kinase)
MTTFRQMPERDARQRIPEFTEGELLQLVLRSDSSLLCVVRVAVARLMAWFEFSEAECRGITRAVDEALANVVRHSYRGRADKPIAIPFRRHPCMTRIGLEILLWDEGDATDFAKLRPRSLEELRPGGLGLHFIREAMDTVEFSRVGDVNQLRLVKYPGSATAGPSF